WIVLQSIFYHLYNQVSYMALDNISPLTFSVGNTMKRVVVIISSIIAFHTKVLPLNAVGSAIAILGTFLYSQAKAHSDKTKQMVKVEADKKQQCSFLCQPSSAVCSSSALLYSTCQGFQSAERLAGKNERPVRRLSSLQRKSLSVCSSSSLLSSHQGTRSYLPSLEIAAPRARSRAALPQTSFTGGKVAVDNTSLSVRSSLFLFGQRLMPVGLGPVPLIRKKPAGGSGVGIVCKAYDAADRSGIVDIPAADPTGTTVPIDTSAAEEGASAVKLAIIFALWYAFNVVFNIYNKKVLNVFPFPWLTSTFSLLAGTLFMLGAWAIKAQPPPPLSKEFMMALAPVALCHTIGHVAATVSMSKVAVSFTHIIKSAEPVFSVFVSSLFLGEKFTLPVYLSLLPIVVGCSIAALTELTFNAAGFWGAMISNIAFVFRNVFSKKNLNNFKEIDGINLYAMICIVSLIYLTPLAIYVEGPAAWSAGWNSAAAQIGAQRLAW
ncbi:hypothetical protein CBR_g79225, partial [Chara braunii]